MTRIETPTRTRGVDGETLAMVRAAFAPGAVRAWLCARGSERFVGMSRNPRACPLAILLRERGIAARVGRHQVLLRDRTGGYSSERMIDGDDIGPFLARFVAGLDSAYRDEEGFPAGMRVTAGQALAVLDGLDV
jgi:hypothetical protein